MQAALILNAASGWKEKEDPAHRIPEILERSGIACTVSRVTAGANIHEIARRAVSQGAELVLAAGGDGTLRAVAGALVGADAALGVLPVGTLNHFARDMDIPLDFEEAARIAASGVCVEVDTAEVNGFAFINNSVIGWYPAYHVERERRERAGAGAWRAFLGAILSTFRRNPLLDARVTAGGLELFRRSAYIFITNNEHAMEGFKPWQRETMTEGALWVYVLKDQSRFAFLWLVLRGLTGRCRPEDFDRIRASAVRIEARRKTMMVSLDGEVMPFQAPLEYRSRPRSLKVMVPRDSRRAAESAHIEGEVRCGS